MDDDKSIPVDETEEDNVKIPWHFWIGVSLAGAYLVYRLVQMIILGFNALF